MFDAVVAALYRIYSVTTRAVCFCPNNVFDNEYLWYSYKVQYNSIVNANSFAMALSSDGVTEQVRRGTTQ